MNRSLTLLNSSGVSESNTWQLISVIIPLVYSLIFLIGTVGNSLVLAVLLRNGQVNNTTNLFILNLGVADLCFIVFCVPFQATIYSLDDWIFGPFMCKAVHFFIYLTMYASSFTLTTVSLDRWVSWRAGEKVWIWKVIVKLWKLSDFNFQTIITFQSPRTPLPLCLITCRENMHPLKNSVQWV